MKHLALLTSLAILAAGCQKTTVSTVIPEDNSDDPVPVRFGLGQPDFNVTVKSVGSLETWGTNDLYIFGYKTGAQEYTDEYVPEGGSESSTLIYNIKATTTGSTTSELLNVINPDTSEPFYYSGKNTYDFYGYHVDDAAATIEGNTWTEVLEGDPTPVVVTAETASTPVSGTTLAKGVYVPFIIDGSQDIMAAEADKAADAAKDDEGTNEVAPEDCYSAYAARRDIQPNLQFRHMLSRFTFQIKPGTDDAKNVEVTGIKIKANTKGFLCVVGDNKGTVIPCAVDEENNPLVDMELQQRSVAGQCEPLEPVSLTEASAEAPVTAGESIMAMAGETSYDIVISTRMNEASGIKTPIADLEKKLTLSENAQFAAGTSYNVTITVYSLEKIEVTATLAEWADGEDITIGEDEDQKPSGN